MAKRGVYVSKKEYPFFEEIFTEFDWFGGFALSQKRKTEISLHRNFTDSYPDRKVLEVSSSGLYRLGFDLSAMNLKKETIDGITSVESAFQSSRVYNDGDEKIGPFPEYKFINGKECKGLVKEASRGLRSYEYRFDGMTFYAPDFHISLFYDYLYMNSLLENSNKEVFEKLISSGYNAFTDLATKSLNSQARSLAIFMGLYSAGRLEEIKKHGLVS